MWDEGGEASEPKPTHHPSSMQYPPRVHCHVKRRRDTLSTPSNSFRAAACQVAIGWQIHRYDLPPDLNWPHGGSRNAHPSMPMPRCTLGNTF